MYIVFKPRARSERGAPLRRVGKRQGKVKTRNRNKTRITPRVNVCRKHVRVCGNAYKIVKLYYTPRGNLVPGTERNRFISGKPLSPKLRRVIVVVVVVVVPPPPGKIKETKLKFEIAASVSKVIPCPLLPAFYLDPICRRLEMEVIRLP